MKKIYNYVLNTMADWELGYALAELNSQRFMQKKHDWKVLSVGASRQPIVTMGGLAITPDATIDDIEVSDTEMLILPGADTWSEPENLKILDKAKTLAAAGVPVAAICGASVALAEAGMLDNVNHTSNGLQQLKTVCPNYKGEAKYKNELAVTDGVIITAGSSAPVEFAYEIFKKLGAFPADHLEYWYTYFGKHNPEGFMKLFNALRITL